MTSDGPRGSEGNGETIPHTDKPAGAVLWGCPKPDDPYWMRLTMFDHKGGSMMQEKEWPLPKCGNTRWTVVIDAQSDMTLHESTRDGYKSQALPTSS